MTENKLKKVFEIVNGHKPEEIAEIKLASMKAFSDSRMKILKISSLSEYIAYLKQNNIEVKKMQNLIKVENVSHFFRDSLVYDIVEEKILPELLAKKDTLRIWSVGCSGGQEPYSLAMVCDSYFDYGYDKNQIRIFATDISEKELEWAKKGVYKKNQMVETKLKIIEKYFTVDGQNYSLSQKIKKAVNFSMHDILMDEGAYPSPAVYGGFDIIFCRNLLIYYSEENQREILSRLIKGLNIGGYLCVGKADYIDAFNKKNLREIIQGLPVYRKL
jgi:chemotaxis protein methyltransferase CheR